MSHTTGRVLVVDDEAPLRRSVSRVLGQAGFEVTTAASVAEAQGFVVGERFDAALVDYGLGRDDGLVVLAALREVQPSCLRVLMTARRDFPMVVEAVNRGEVLRVLSKPFDADQLLALLNDALASHRELTALGGLRRADAGLEAAMLAQCMKNELLFLAVQPIVSANDGHRIAAFEALLRSRHPVLGGPLEVLHAAENTSEMRSLGRYIFGLAARTVPRLPVDTSLFVNVHPSQLADPGEMMDDLQPLLDHAPRVVLEITERSSLQALPGWERTIHAITAAGFHIALDDLGSGYNSLSMLADLQPRYIKLDMSLVRNVHREPRKQRLVSLLATFAEATHAAVIAEGVENADEAGALLDTGVHFLQGYHFGKPAPLAE